jgi:hypothetical protein
MYGMQTPIFILGSLICDAGSPGLREGRISRLMAQHTVRLDDSGRIHRKQPEAEREWR